MKTYKILGLLTILALLIAAMPLQTARAAGVYYVSPAGNDGNDCVSTATACLTIQAAINKASPGDTINVAAGTYQPSLADWKELEILKSLKLVGAGSGSTIVQFTAGVMNGLEILGTGLDVTLQGLTFTREDGSATSANYPLRIGEVASTFTNLTLRDVEVAYAGAMNLWSGATIASLTVENCSFLNSVAYGFASFGTITSGTVTDSHFDDNTGVGLHLAGPTSDLVVYGGTMNHNGGNGFSGRQLNGVTFHDVVASNNGTLIGWGFIISEQIAGSGSSNVTFENVTASDNASDGIDLYTYPGFSISNVSILGGTFNNNGFKNKPNPNGIRVDGSSGGPISNITIDGVTVLGQYREAILVRSATNVRVINSHLEGSNLDAEGTNTLQFRNVVGGEISGNTIRNSRSSGIFVLSSSNLDIDANNASNNAVTGIALLTSSGIDVTRNTVNSNPGNTDYPGGITIAASCSNIAVTNNFIGTNTFGVWVKDTAGAGITVHANSIVGNTTAGVKNNSANVVDATCNWWGAANGPGPVGPGSGDKVSAGVNFLPWLITSDLNGPCIGGLTFTVDASVTGGHGSATPASQTVECPDSATINISPDTGYHIASITDNGNPAAIANPYVISNVTANHTVVVTFAIDTFDVNASVIGGHGSVSPATQTVDWNTSASISITPELGYHIATITDNLIAMAITNPYMISNVTDNHTVVVTFAPTVPETKEKCKNDGWISVRRADGSPFKNQGDCIQYVNTGK